jgi:hypothetical protein
MLTPVQAACVPSAWPGAHTSRWPLPLARLGPSRPVFRCGEDGPDGLGGACAKTFTRCRRVAWGENVVHGILAADEVGSGATRTICAATPVNEPRTKTQVREWSPPPACSPPPAGTMQSAHAPHVSGGAPVAGPAKAHRHSHIHRQRDGRAPVPPPPLARPRPAAAAAAQAVPALTAGRHRRQTRRRTGRRGRRPCAACRSVPCASPRARCGAA